MFYVDLNQIMATTLESIVVNFGSTIFLWSIIKKTMGYNSKSLKKSVNQLYIFIYNSTKNFCGKLQPPHDILLSPINCPQVSPQVLSPTFKDTPMWLEFH